MMAPVLRSYTETQEDHPNSPVHGSEWLKSSFEPLKI